MKNILSCMVALFTVFNVNGMAPSFFIPEANRDEIVETFKGITVNSEPLQEEIKLFVENAPQDFRKAYARLSYYQSAPYCQLVCFLDDYKVAKRLIDLGVIEKGKAYSALDFSASAGTLNTMHALMDSKKQKRLRSAPHCLPVGNQHHMQTVLLYYARK